MPYKHTLEEELKHEVFQTIMEYIEKRYKVSDNLYDILSDSLSEALTTFAEKIREGIVEEVEKKKKNEGGEWYVGPDDGMGYDEAIPYNQALDDLLAQLKDK